MCSCRHSQLEPVPCAVGVGPYCTTCYIKLTDFPNPLAQVLTTEPSNSLSVTCYSLSCLQCPKEGGERWLKLAGPNVPEGSQGHENVASVFDFLCSIITYLLYKLTLSDQSNPLWAALCACCVLPCTVHYTGTS